MRMRQPNINAGCGRPAAARRPKTKRAALACSTTWGEMRVKTMKTKKSSSLSAELRLSVYFFIILFLFGRLPFSYFDKVPINTDTVSKDDSNNSMSMYLSALWSSVSSLVSRLLETLGLQGKEGSIILLGLDNAGKTTLLHRLQTDTIRSFPPTDRPTESAAAIQLGGIQFRVTDLGGHEAVRHLWSDYLTENAAVLFVVDAADAVRLEEAAYELDALLHTLDTNIAVCVLLNKCDLPEALSTASILQKLEWERLEQERKSKDAESAMAIFRISVFKGEGYSEAFRWVGKYL
jgi:GTP-binding protein SAR1